MISIASEHPVHSNFTGGFHGNANRHMGGELPERYGLCHRSDTDTDSGLESLDRGTPVRTLRAAQRQTLVKTGDGSHCQTSTPKPKLMLATQCYVKELYAQIPGPVHLSRLSFLLFEPRHP